MCRIKLNITVVNNVSIKKREARYRKSSSLEWNYFEIPISGDFFTPDIQEDGAYDISVRIQSNLNVWSNWSTPMQFYVSPDCDEGDTPIEQWLETGVEGWYEDLDGDIPNYYCGTYYLRQLQNNITNEIRWEHISTRIVVTTEQWQEVGEIVYSSSATEYIAGGGSYAWIQIIQTNRCADSATYGFISYRRKPEHDVPTEGYIFSIDKSYVLMNCNTETHSDVHVVSMYNGQATDWNVLETSLEENVTFAVNKNTNTISFYYVEIEDPLHPNPNTYVFEVSDETVNLGCTDSKEVTVTSTKNGQPENWLIMQNALGSNVNVSISGNKIIFSQAKENFRTK